MEVLPPQLSPKQVYKLKWSAAAKLKWRSLPPCIKQTYQTIPSAWKSGFLSNRNPLSQFKIHVKTGLPERVFLIRPELYNWYEDICKQVASIMKVKSLDISCPWMNNECLKVIPLDNLWNFRLNAVPFEITVRASSSRPEGPPASSSAFCPSTFEKSNTFTKEFFKEMATQFETTLIDHVFKSDNDDWCGVLKQLENAEYALSIMPDIVNSDNFRDMKTKKHYSEFFPEIGIRYPQHFHRELAQWVSKAAAVTRGSCKQSQDNFVITQFFKKSLRQQKIKKWLMDKYEKWQKHCTLFSPQSGKALFSLTDMPEDDKKKVKKTKKKKTKKTKKTVKKYKKSKARKAARKNVGALICNSIASAHSVKDHANRIGDHVRLVDKTDKGKFFDSPRPGSEIRITISPLSYFASSWVKAISKMANDKHRYALVRIFGTPLRDFAGGKKVNAILLSYAVVQRDASLSGHIFFHVPKHFFTKIHILINDSNESKDMPWGNLSTFNMRPKKANRYLSYMVNNMSSSDDVTRVPQAEDRKKIHENITNPPHFDAPDNNKFAIIDQESIFDKSGFILPPGSSSSVPDNDQESTDSEEADSEEDDSTPAPVGSHRGAKHSSKSGKKHSSGYLMRTSKSYKTANSPPSTSSPYVMSSIASSSGGASGIGSKNKGHSGYTKKGAKGSIQHGKTTPFLYYPGGESASSSSYVGNILTDVIKGDRMVSPTELKNHLAKILPKNPDPARPLENYERLVKMFKKYFNYTKVVFKSRPDLMQFESLHYIDQNGHRVDIIDKTSRRLGFCTETQEVIIHYFPMKDAWGGTPSNVLCMLLFSFILPHPELLEEAYNGANPKAIAIMQAKHAARAQKEAAEKAGKGPTVDPEHFPSITGPPNRGEMQRHDSKKLVPKDPYFNEGGVGGYGYDASSRLKPDLKLVKSTTPALSVPHSEDLSDSSSSSEEEEASSLLPTVDSSDSDESGESSSESEGEPEVPVESSSESEEEEVEEKIGAGLAINTLKDHMFSGPFLESVMLECHDTLERNDRIVLIKNLKLCKKMLKAAFLIVTGFAKSISFSDFLDAAHELKIKHIPDLEIVPNTANRVGYSASRREWYIFYTIGREIPKDMVAKTICQYFVPHPQILLQALEGANGNKPIEKLVAIVNGPSWPQLTGPTNKGALQSPTSSKNKTSDPLYGEGGMSATWGTLAYYSDPRSALSSSSAEAEATHIGIRATDTDPAPVGGLFTKSKPKAPFVSFGGYVEYSKAEKLLNRLINSNLARMLEFSPRESDTHNIILHFAYPDKVMKDRRISKGVISTKVNYLKYFLLHTNVPVGGPNKTYLINLPGGTLHFNPYPEYPHKQMLTFCAASGCKTVIVLYGDIIKTAVGPGNSTKNLWIVKIPQFQQFLQDRYVRAIQK